MRTLKWAAVVVGLGLVGSEIQAEEPVKPKPPKKVLRAPTMYVTGHVVDTVEAAPETGEPKPEDALRLALRHKRASLEHCFEKELRKQAVFSGFVVLLVNVSMAGRVTRAEVQEGSPREAAVGTCIARQLRLLKLPPLAYEADLLVPIRLEAKQPTFQVLSST